MWFGSYAQNERKNNRFDDCTEIENKKHVNLYVKNYILLITDAESR